MKKLNKKGFTLIELLAVIVILAILVAVAVPAVTKYLNTARDDAFKDNAQIAISAVRNDVVINGYNNTAATHSGTTTTYDKDAINGLLEKKLTKSPYGKNYTAVVVTVTEGATTSAPYTFSICITDGDHKISANEEGIVGATIDTGSNLTCN